jgi:hypothetical protein
VFVCVQMLPFNILFSRATPTAINTSLISIAISRVNMYTGHIYLSKVDSGHTEDRMLLDGWMARVLKVLGGNWVLESGESSPY